MTADSFGVAVNGVSGFAWVHHRILAENERRGRCRLLGYCDHLPSAASEEIKLRYFFAERRVREFSSFQSMLATLGPDCRLAFIPSPIHRHAADHRASMQARVACYLEKPPTLDPGELETMIRDEDTHDGKTIVGFNLMANPQRLRLKERMVAGEFGALQRVTLLGFWPRAAEYYSRSNWPGRLVVGDQLVLDSVFGNAMAHFLHAALFWAETKEVWSWARAAQVEAELYRAHAIEGTDTLFARGTLSDAVSFRFALSHACLENLDPVETLIFDQAVITIDAESVTVRRDNGTVETISLGVMDTHQQSIERALTEARGEAVEVPSVALADCRSFVELNALFYSAAQSIHSVAADSITSRAGFLGIAEVEAAGREFIQSGRLPSEQRRAWGRPGGHAEQFSPALFPTVIGRLRAMPV